MCQVVSAECKVTTTQVLLEVLAQNFRTHVLTLVVHVSEGTARVGGGPLVAHGRQEGVVPPHLRPRVVEPGAGEGRTRPASAFGYSGWNGISTGNFTTVC